MLHLQAHALNRVMACNGSIDLGGTSEVPPENEQSESRREGIAAHFVATTVISGQFQDPIEWVDRKTPNGVYVTPEMAEYVEPFVVDVLANSKPEFRWIETEHDYDMSPAVRILARPDVLTWDAETETLSVYDFKYGFRPVNVQRNWTLVAYLVAWVINHRIIPTTVRMVIHQPRPHHEDGKRRELIISYDELLILYQELFNRLTNLDGMVHTNPFCYKCPALANCPAARNAGYNVVDASSITFNDTMSNDEATAQIMLLERAIEMGKQRLTALNELVEHRIKSGQVIQDWMLEASLGNTRYKPGVNSAVIKALTGIDVRKDTLLTPNQAIKKGVPELVMKTLTERPNTGFKLVHKSASKVAAKMFETPKEG